MRALLVGLLLTSAASAAIAADPLVIHEWGTFTSLQNETGVSLGRINTDDEPVPAFVHTLKQTYLFNPTTAFTGYAKGFPAGDPLVTMRLETPVLYFHRPKNFVAPASLDLKVTYKGGWLTQYFPDAAADVEGTLTVATSDYVKRPPLAATSVSTLEWKNIKLGSADGEIPQTKDKVWLAPRDVKADDVTVGNEREKFLFYRGVGNMDSPVTVTWESNGPVIHGAADFASDAAWIVDIQPDHKLAFKSVGKIAAKENKSAGQFQASEYGDNLATLRDAMKKELVAGGLFTDEAEAMLNTWERSYFQNPGLRVFYMVPQSWTDKVMPISINTESKITRVMVGRIEIVSPKQRELLKQIAAEFPAINAADLNKAVAALNTLQKDPTKQEAYNAIAGGSGNLADLGVPVPDVYKHFLELGRFRTSLLLNSPNPAHQRLSQYFAPDVMPVTLFPTGSIITVPTPAGPAPAK